MKNAFTAKAKVLLLLLLAMTGMAKAQQWNEPNDKSPKDLYLSYFGNDSTNINIMHEPCQGADLYYLLSGVIYNKDTITINGKQYYYREPQSLGIIIEPVYHYLFPRQDTLFLREERETGRLYRYYRNYFGMGETEKLICDMTLEVGDRFVVLDNYCLYEREYEVSQVYYDHGLKTILLTDMYERIFQEGVFPSEYPLWQESLSDLWGDGYGSADRLRLLCESKDGALVYGEDNGCLPDINKVEKIEKRVAVFPNPTNNIVIIEGVIADEVKIYNTFGQLVKTVTDSNEIDMDGLAEGVYLLKVTDKEGAIHTGKVMKKSK